MRTLWVILLITAVILSSPALYALDDEGAFPKQVPPKKVSMDTNYDSKIDRVEFYDTRGQISRLETDTNNDGIIDEWVTFDREIPIKKEKDTNADGKPDVWVEY